MGVVMTYSTPCVCVCKDFSSYSTLLNPSFAMQCLSATLQAQTQSPAALCDNAILAGFGQQSEDPPE
jgi:hypothetical protein